MNLRKEKSWIMLSLGIAAAWFAWGIGTAVAATFNAKMLKGTYVYSASGQSLVSGPNSQVVGSWIVQNGIFTLSTDGSVTGNITSYDDLSNVECAGSIDGTYSVNSSNGSGSLTLNFTPNKPSATCQSLDNITQPIVVVNKNLIDLIQVASPNNLAALSGTLQRQQ